MAKPGKDGLSENRSRLGSGRCTSPQSPGEAGPGPALAPRAPAAAPRSRPAQPPLTRSLALSTAAGIAPALTEMPPAACVPGRFSGMAPAAGSDAALSSGSGGGSALMPRPCPRRLGTLRDNGDAADAAAGPAPSWAPRPAAACGSGGGASGDAEGWKGGWGWSR